MEYEIINDKSQHAKFGSISVGKENAEVVVHFTSATPHHYFYRGLKDFMLRCQVFTLAATAAKVIIGY